MKSDPKILDLDALERRAHAATPGPWETDGGNVVRSESVPDDDGDMGVDVCVDVCEVLHHGRAGSENARTGTPEHIAGLSPDVVLALVAEIRRLRSNAPQAPTAPTLDVLSPAQRRIFDLVVEGRGNREIAAQLGISIKTVDAHRSAIHRRLGTHDAADLVRLSVRLAPAAEVSHG